MLNSIAPEAGWVVSSGLLRAQEPSPAAHAAMALMPVGVTSPPGGYTETFVNQFHIQATGGAESFLVTELFHVTVTPDGTVRVMFDNFSSTC